MSASNSGVDTGKIHKHELTRADQVSIEFMCSVGNCSCIIDTSAIPGSRSEWEIEDIYSQF